MSSAQNDRELRVGVAAAALVNKANAAAAALVEHRKAVARAEVGDRLYQLSRVRRSRTDDAVQALNHYINQMAEMIDHA